METTPDLERALAHYALIADRYDDETRKIVAIRRKAIDALQLVPGQTVLDAGCGTGACLPALAQRVGDGGLVVGIQPSQPLLDHARARVANLSNVQLVQTTAQQANLASITARPFDAVRMAARSNGIWRIPPGFLKRFCCSALRVATGR